MRPSSPVAGQVIGGYRLVRVLGQGGTGIVFLAEEVASSRRAALKVLWTPQGISPSLARGFAAEQRLLAAIDHPNVVRIQGAGIDGPNMYLVMEHLDGETLRQRLGSGAAGLDAVARWGEELLSALAAIHAAGILHRDLTPSNIILVPERLVVLDFGLAKVVTDETITRSRPLRMTLAYAPPERFLGAALTVRADLYQAGLVLFEIATGRPPFVASEPSAIATAHLTATPPTVRSIVPSLPPLLDRVIAKALAKQPQDRYGSAVDLLEDLRVAVRR